MSERYSILTQLRLLSIVIIFILFSLLAYYAYTPSETDTYDMYQKRIVFVSPQTDNPVWLQAKAGFDEAAEEFGFHGIWIGGGNCNVEDMTREIKISIAENADAIITCPLTPSLFSEVFADALKKNIPVITLAVDAETPELRSAYIGSDYKKLGAEQAAALYEKCGVPMKIGVIMSGFDTQNQVIQVEQLTDFIKDIPDAEIVDRKEDGSDPLMGMSIFPQMLSEHPEINALFITSGGAVSTYGNYLLEHNLNDSITLIGMDIVPDNLASIRSGAVYGVMSQDFYSMGYLGGKYAYEASFGREIPPVTYTDSELITSANVNKVVEMRADIE